MKIETDLQLQAPAQEFCQDVMREYFALPGETTALQIRTRLAASVAQDPAQERRFLECLEGGFVPECGSSGLGAFSIDCVVQEVGDAITGKDRNGVVGIFDALGKATEVLRRGACVAYDFSRVRPRGAPVRGTSSKANGPVAFMKIFDTAGRAVAPAGTGRGIQMGVLRVDHPDIELFVDANAPAGNDALSSFKMSLALTDEFMQAVHRDGDFDLVHQEPPAAEGLGQKTRGDGAVMHVHRTVRARSLWERIVRNTYEGAELGCLFIDLANAGNNLRYAERIEAANPSGSQCLPANGCSAHGSLMLHGFVRNAYTASAVFDWVALKDVIHPAIEYLDQVLDKTVWPSPEHQVEAQTKRRIGLGYFGLADALAMLGIRYDSPMAARFAAQLGEFIRDVAYRASVRLAVRSGAFALFNADKFLEEGTFASRLPQSIQDDIRATGIRNSHLLSVAPCSAAALAFGDNASSGIEPISELRQCGVPLNGARVGQNHLVENGAYRAFKLAMGNKVESNAFVTAEHLSVDAQMAVFEAAARSVDASIGLTVRAPGDCSIEDFGGIYQRAWRAGLKSIAAVRRTSIS